MILIEIENLQTCSFRCQTN